MTPWATRDTGLFRGGEQTETFRRMAMIHPCRRIARAPQAMPLARKAQALELPACFHVDGTSVDTQAFLKNVRATGLIVLKGGDVALEQYWHGYAADTQAMSFSVAKSFVSTLVAFALRDGHITSLSDPVDLYAPELKGSGYQGVSLKDVLQMSSGVRWNEEYTNPDSDVARFGHAFDAGGSFDAVCASLPREHAPGSYNRYNSCDTHVLGMVVARATGKALSEYLEEQLWHPLGMQDDAFFLIDGKGVEAAAMGLNVTLRDYARFGQFMANRGVIDGRSLLPDGWYAGCSTATESHLLPGPRANANYPHGYGYQWWLPGDQGTFVALGVYFQCIWISPDTDTVIVKTGADPCFGVDMDAMKRSEIQHFALFRALCTL